MDDSSNKFNKFDRIIERDYIDRLRDVDLREFNSLCKKEEAKSCESENFGLYDFQIQMIKQFIKRFIGANHAI